MKIFEVVTPSLNDVRADVEDYLFSLMAQGVEEVPTSDVVAYLQDSGNSVDLRSLLDVLDTVSLAKNANEEKISLVSQVSNDVVDVKKRTGNKDRVKQLARKSSDIM